MKLRLIVASLAFVAPFSAFAADIEFDKLELATDLSGIHTVTTIDDQLYVMEHVKSGDVHAKRLYRFESTNAEPELLHAETGVLSLDDQIINYDGALYHTITQKRGKPVLVYRSQDDGESWDEVGAVGFSNYRVINEVLAVMSSAERLYMIVAPARRFDAQPTRVSVWSTANGSKWKKQIIKWDKNQELIGAVVLNNRPFVLTVGREAESSPVVRLYTTFQSNGWKLQKTAVDNISEDNPIEVPTALTVADSQLFITGTDSDGEEVSLVSTDGVQWTPTTFVFSQVVSLDGTLFAPSGNDLYVSSDGETWTSATLSFEDELALESEELFREFTLAQDGSGLLARVWSATEDEEAESDAECWWSADAVAWNSLESCAPVQERAHRRVVQFGDFWYGIRGKNIPSVYRFAL